MTLRLTFLRRKAASAIVVASLVGGLVFLRFYLDRTTGQFIQNFARQNTAEIAAGDTMSLSRRLGSLTGSVPLVCVSGTKAGVVFLEQKNGRCSSGFFVQRAVIDREASGGIRLEFFLTLPSELKGAGIALIFMQCLLLFALGVAARREERARLAHEIERQRLEGEMNAIIAQTTQMLAHDVRRPFATLQRGLSMIVNETDPEAIKMTAQLLTREVGKSSEAVRVMLDDILLAGGLSSLRTEALSLAEVIGASIDDVTLNARAKDIVWEKSFTHSHSVRGDARKLSRVWTNILSNAVDAVGEDGRIWVTSHDVLVKGEPCVEVVLGNNGPVIPDDQLPKVFDLFFTAGKSGGTGLGLAIVRKIVEAHGGTIFCRSVQGHGVEFVVTLPA